MAYELKLPSGVTMSGKGCWQTTGQLVNPKGIVTYLLCSLRVLNPVFLSSPYRIVISWYVFLQSSLVPRYWLFTVVFSGPGRKTAYCPWFPGISNIFLYCFWLTLVPLACQMVLWDPNNSKAPSTGLDQMCFAVYFFVLHLAYWVCVTGFNLRDNGYSLLPSRLSAGWVLLKVSSC